MNAPSPSEVPASNCESSPPDEPESDLITAKQAARMLRVHRDWVYSHALEIGGWRLLGDHGPWRFSRIALSKPLTITGAAHRRHAMRPAGLPRRARPTVVELEPRARQAAARKPRP
jgi:hypothetical protein